MKRGRSFTVLFRSSRRPGSVARHGRDLYPAVDCNSMTMMMVIIFETFLGFIVPYWQLNSLLTYLHKYFEVGKITDNFIKINSTMSGKRCLGDSHVTALLTVKYFHKRVRKPSAKNKLFYCKFNFVTLTPYVRKLNKKITPKRNIKASSGIQAREMVDNSNCQWLFRCAIAAQYLSLLHISFVH